MSEWAQVLSGVPQGSVLGPLLFLIYINDTDEGIISKICKFADDTKLGWVADSEEAVDALRQDLRKLYQWSVDWQMLFNDSKCVVMHLGAKNNKAEYRLGNSKLMETEQEKDLGIIIHNNSKSSAQCLAVAKKANAVLGMIRRNIKNKDKDTVLRLYKGLVRPHLEHNAPVWSLHLKKDIEMLEQVQRRATKMIKGMWNVE